MLVYANPCIHHRRDYVGHVAGAIDVHHRESIRSFSHHHKLHAYILRHCCQRLEVLLCYCEVKGVANFLINNYNQNHRYHQNRLHPAAIVNVIVRQMEMTQPYAIKRRS